MLHAAPAHLEMDIVQQSMHENNATPLERTTSGSSKRPGQGGGNVEALALIGEYPAKGVTIVFGANVNQAGAEHRVSGGVGKCLGESVVASFLECGGISRLPCNHAIGQRLVESPWSR